MKNRHKVVRQNEPTPSDYYNKILSPKMIEIAQKNSPKTLFINDDIKNVELKNSSYDVIFAGSFVHLFPQNDLKIVLKKYIIG